MSRSPRPLSDACGQAAAEFVGLLLLACLTFGALLTASSQFDGRSEGGFLARHFVCAVSGRCDRDQADLAAAYGERDAATVRSLAPGLVYEGGERELPVDWRHCRRVACATAADDGRLDAHITGRGLRATAFTRLIRRRGRVYVAYWLYYPDSNSALAGSDKVWERSWLLPRMRALLNGTPDYPGFHRDDWEGVFVRLDPDGSAWARASSHGGFQSCKWRVCHDRWTGSTGWVRVSRGSHSGHVPFRSERTWRHTVQAGPRFYVPPAGRPRRVPLMPGRDLSERSSSAEGIRLIPLETLDRGRYVPLDPRVKPPWRKRAYNDPESDES
jgi:hypothetical protein